MAWRGIHLSPPAYLCVEHNCLKLEFRDELGGTFSQPIEDLSYLVLDNPSVALSGRCLSALAEANVLVLGVNSKHLPVWTALPWTNFHRQGEVLQLQMAASLPLKKQLWSRTVQAKILAQAKCLFDNALDGSESLARLSKNVRSGDPDNVEARAARMYWSFLFPSTPFVRHQDDFPNALLDYGYAIVRSAIARNLCAIGFVTQLGIHHDSLANAYNLADDLIEPFRPLVDHFVLDVLRASPPSSAFETPHRQALVRLMQANFSLDGNVLSTMAAIEATSASLKRALAENNPSLLVFPSFVPK